MNKLAWYALVVWLLATLSGCLFETTLDATGAGAMTMSFHIDKAADLQVIKQKLEGAAIKLLSAEQEETASGLRARVKIAFDDVTKLPSTKFFQNVRITRADGVEGSTVLTAVVRRDRSVDLNDAVLAKLGKEVKIVTTLPGPVIESNGKVSDGNTVTWTWGMKEFHKQTEILMTVAYKPVPLTPRGTPG